MMPIRKVVEKASCTDVSVHKASCLMLSSGYKPMLSLLLSLHAIHKVQSVDCHRGRFHSSAAGFWISWRHSFHWIYRERFVPDKAITLRIPENAVRSEAVFAQDRHVDGCRRQHRNRGQRVVLPVDLLNHTFL